MYNIDAHRADSSRNPARLKQLGPKRDWMSTGTYHCYPITVANTLGYGLSFEKDISFYWDGDTRNPAIATEGKEYVWSGRPEGTISFDTNLIFMSDESVSLLTLPVPNQFIKGISVITTLLSTSFWNGTFPVVCKLDEPGEYHIPAGTDIACLIPFSTKALNNSNINYIDEVYSKYRVHNDPEYVDAIHQHVDENGQQPKLYKKGIDHHGNKVGEHEIDKLTLTVTYKEKGE